MKPSPRRAAPGVLLLGLLGPASLAAQVHGLPVRNAGIGTGIGAGADLGRPNADLGKGLAYGLTGQAGFGRIGATVSLARHDPAGGAAAVNSAGATLNLKVFGGPLVPLAVTLQGGLGYHTAGSIEGGRIRNVRVPVGLGVAMTIPNPVFSIKPWLAPRLDLRHTRETGGAVIGALTRTTRDFGISGGVEFGFLSGLSVRVMYDRILAGAGHDPSVLSVGAGFRVGR